ncbi:hypothetical protein IC235_02515 [Hymenobacter sp. BT664]|uniref:Uncharacterized protein n=1 Tax=Hymenobacter montanus TaxID=2771359 RepID=A0A927B9S1_9BACT|nr:hypothetical protein [Hymenobacter montanus]MBD2766762.1 hypothetical protein [Hymenobacter montanus]
MYFPALFSGLRRLGRWLVYELFQLALWAAFGLHTLASLRSAFGGGGERVAGERPGPAVRPRRAAGPGRGERFNPPAAA